MPRSTRLSRRLARPSLEPLEARWVPATVAYNPTYQSLTVTTDTDDTITVSQLSNRPAGFLQITDGTSTVFSGTVFVKNLRIDARADQFSNVTIASETHLAGSLSVLGGTLVSAFSIGDQCFIGGGVSYTSTAAAQDSVSIGQLTSVAGAVNINNGTGGSFTQLRGLSYGSLQVTAGSGNDAVNLAAGASLSVTGNAIIQLGSGVNGVNVQNLCTIGGGLGYSGGNGADTFFIASGQRLRVAGNVVLNLGPSTGTDGDNGVTLRTMQVGGTVAYYGGNGKDYLEIGDDVFIARDLIASLRGGNNTGDIGATSVGVRVLGNFKWTGGSGEDRIDLDSGVMIGRNVAVALGDNFTPVTGQKFETGGLVQVLGAVTVTGGVHADEIDLEDLLVSKSVLVNTGAAGADEVYFDGSLVTGSFTVYTGAGSDLLDFTGSYFLGAVTLRTGAGNDAVRIDECQVFGPAVFDVGSGGDVILLETKGNSGDSSFGSTVSFIGGTGADQLFISNGTGLVRFGGRVTFNGGSEFDPVPTFADTIFLLPSLGTW